MSEERTSWSQQAGSSERVRAIALTLQQPRNAGWIANEAEVARATAKKYLEQFVDNGDLVTLEVGRETRYMPDPVTGYLREVRELIEEFDKDTLTSELAAINDEIDAWKDQYDVETAAVLRQSVGDSSIDSEERRKRIHVAEDWEYNQYQRELIQHALGLYDSIQRRSPGLSDGANSPIA